MPDRDFYRTLGVPREATAEELQRAYRTLARRHHPDVNKEPGAEERFKQITEAYDVLSDPERRRRYDRYGEHWRQAPDVEPAGARRRATARQRAAAAAGPGGGYGPAGGDVHGGDAHGGDTRAAADLEDLLDSLFGERGRGADPFATDTFGRAPVRGADTEAELTVTLEEAFRGARRRVTLSGTTTEHGRPRQYEVTIPAGVVDGQRIRLAGQGAAGGRGGPAGDLYLVVRVAPHPRFRLDGRDVVVHLPITPWEGALGATVPVEGPAATVRVDVPPGTSTGRRLRLRGQGLPNPRGAPGDLYAEIRVSVPPSLSRHERELFEELARVSSFNPREGAP